MGVPHHPDSWMVYYVKSENNMDDLGVFPYGLETSICDFSLGDEDFVNWAIWHARTGHFGGLTRHGF